MLDFASIIRQAEERTAFTDREADLHRNLARLVDSLNGDSILPERSVARIHAGLVERTVHRLQAQQWLQDHPEIADETIVAPVFLTGLPRSGTTFFQYLFDHDTRFRLLRSWESATPFPPPGFDPESAIQRKEEERRQKEAVRHHIAGLEALHLMDADGPEECYAIMEQSYASAGYHNLYDVPSYFDYLLEELDFERAYRTHKRQLQCLQWRTPQPRWALKFPNHTLAMDVILKVYPDARFVMTHRDPVQTLASICKLTCTLRNTLYDQPVDPKQVGRQMLYFVRRHIDRIMAFCQSAQGSRVTHVDYYRLVDNPPKIMEEVHAGLGIDSPQAVRDAVAEWHRANPKGARGTNPYSADTYGIDPDEAATLFSDYKRYFDIPREQEGMQLSSGRNSAPGR